MRTPSDRLLETVVDILATQGYEGVSVRRVATQAGVSIGAVQHHFPTKDAMLDAAMAWAADSFRRRLEERVPADADAVVALRGLCDELLGLGDERREVSVLWIVRLARAVVDPRTAEVHAREWQEIENLLARLLGAARPDQVGGWARDQAGLLLAVLDGLATAGTAEPVRMPRARAEAVLSQVLDQLLTSAR